VTELAAATPTRPSDPTVRVTLRTGSRLWHDVVAHILEDGASGGAGALLCGVVERDGRTTLLARAFVPAVDSVDHVRGTVGHHALTPKFVRRVLSRARSRRLVPLFVHGHGGHGRVEFSPTDMWSHERGYPALVDIAGQSVGALVLAGGAAAGDVWLADGRRAPLAATVVVGPNITRILPRPEIAAAHRPEDDRQARLFGDEGQEILRRSKVGVIGAGGAGMLAVEYLSRLGVGWLVAVDADRVAVTNLPRLPGATRLDALAFLTCGSRPDWLRRLGERLSTPKVRIARRIARNAGQGTRVTAVRAEVQTPAAAAALVDCDYIVLAADTATARYLANVLAHQYLIPMVQVGVKILVDDDGVVGDVFAVTRTVVPDGGCLRCAGLIDAARLAVESLPEAERRAADYGTGQPAPSVIALNAMAVSRAVAGLVLALTGLVERAEPVHVRDHARRQVTRTASVVADPDCTVCGANGVTSLGDLAPLPTSRRRPTRPPRRPTQSALDP